MLKKLPLYLLLVCAAVMVATSCKKNDDDTSSSTTVYSNSRTTTQVMKFYIKANADVMENLDSVFFTIDPDRSIIYNADSLPVNTKVTGLVPSVTFASSVRSVVFSVTGGTARKDTTFTYRSTVNDSIDFTGFVTMAVTSSDGTSVHNYEVKVNVHKVNPDSLVWPQQWRRSLPGNGVSERKTVFYSGRFVTLAKEESQYMLYATGSPLQGTWESQPMPFEPAVESFSSTTDNLYVLDKNGNLFESSDGLEWNAAGVTWYSVLGGYGSRLLGVMRDGDEFLYDEYPRPDGYITKMVDANFPVRDASQLVEMDNTWSVHAQALLAGGTTASGKNSAAVWGYDGKLWAQISRDNKLPALRNATLLCYYSYKKRTGTARSFKNPTWLVMGGRTTDGLLNNKVYASTDQCITWGEAATSMQLPAYVVGFWGAQAFVIEEDVSATSAQAPRFAAPVQPVTSWKCPYVYLLGGYGQDGTPLDYMWRGVLNRLMFKPLY
ncbi:MAG: hypothetical protein J6N71_08070 [Muribaculaceae bacterium]|nr:hypothetical protein [Muribaculaceae bacterium]